MLRILLLTLTLSSFLFAAHISWMSNYDKAHKRAVSENKKLMILLLEEQSPQNSELLKESFMNQVYIKSLNNEFISVLIIKDQLVSYPIENLFTTHYPTLFFLDKQELFFAPPLILDINPESIKAHLYLNNIIRTPVR